MRITSKGQVTIPQAIRNATGLQAHTEVDIVYENGEVLLRPVKRDAQAAFKTALKQARAVPLTKEFRGKSADEIMDFLRGE
jgi:AbrB family looped-hinge helix DNA binding protein